MRKKVFQLSSFLALILFLWLSTTAVWAEMTPVTTPEQIVLSLTGNSEEMAVSWCDNVTTSDEAVIYSTDPDLLSEVKTAAAELTVSESGYQYYEATMTGLESGKTYYYQVGTMGKMSGTKSFCAASDSSVGYDFIYLGDVQFNDNSTMASEYDTWGRLVQNARDRNPNAAFILQGGDMVNKGQNMEEWQALLTKSESVFSGMPLMSVPGNHEGNDASGKPELWSEIFDLPTNGPSGFKEEFYSFDYGNSHILCLNSNVFSNEQLNAGTMSESDFDRINDWIAKDLSSTDKTWKIVVLHHPAYVVVDDPVSSQVLNKWVPIFEDNGVSLVLCGHQHVYMRTYPMADREISTYGGITYIMGDSGSKFYPAADIPYDASMIENTSTYQQVSIKESNIAVTTYDAEGNVLDSAVVTQPEAAEHSISLDYNTSIAAVSAPAKAASGSAVTLNVSGIAAGKKVYNITVEDKNGKSYPVTTITANLSYSFIMPNRSVTAEILFEDGSAGGVPGDKYYACSIDTGDDPIWNVSVASSGLSEDNSKIKAGSTVTVTVTKNNEAITAKLTGLSVQSGGGAVAGTQSGSGNKIKYQFTMPDGAVTVAVEADYEGLKVYAREKTSDSYVLKDTLSRSEMISNSESNAYYTGYDRFPTAVIGKADQYVTLKELLHNCGIELTESSSITLSARDGAESTFSYGDLYGKTRYYFPNIKEGSSSGKKSIEPMLVIKGYQSRFINLPDGKTIDDMPPDTACAYRLAFGQTQEEFNNGVASETYATVGDFLKWTNSIKVSGYKAVDEEEKPAGGGGAVDVETVVSGNKASVTPDLTAVKESLNKAVEAGKTNHAVPRVSIIVPMQDGIKSVEVTVTKEVLNELLTSENLILNVSTPFGSTEFNTTILKILKKEAADKEIKIIIAPVDQKEVKSEDGRELTGNNIEITITIGDQKVKNFDGEKMGVRIPFTPDPAKKQKGYYVVWLAEDGNNQRMQGSLYNSADKAMEFETDHLSGFGVAYTTDTAVNVFTDVKEGAWYAPYATYATENGLFKGTSETTFGPDASMTRAMLVTVLGRANNIKIDNTAATVFKDVNSSDWYGSYVGWAYKNGIINGVGSGKFAPNQPITREQLTTILKNYWIWKQGQAGNIAVINQNTLTFSDKAHVSKWAAASVAFCIEKGWITGYSDGSFSPDKSATRAEVSKVLRDVFNGQN